jgi:asparagine synthase (glutamine-hydrolysing)
MHGIWRSAVSELESLRASPLAREVRRRKLTYLTPAKLRVLEESVQAVRRDGVPGDFLEFGVALGGSAILIASHLDRDRAFHGYDVFGMIPAPGAEDDERSWDRYKVIESGRSAGIGGDTYYGYVGDLYERVRASFAAFDLPVDGSRIALHRGLFEETLDLEDRRPVAFAHIDCDWHDPVAYCLAALRRRLALGGVIVLDDYNDYGGCRKAVDAFVASCADIRFLARAPNAVLTRAA